MQSFADTVRRAWPVLLEAIRAGRTVSYSELASRAGRPLNPRNVHRVLLQPLSAGCRRAGLPNLAALVVRKDTGVPGGGWFEPGSSLDPLGAWAEALAACYAYPWSNRLDQRLLTPDPTGV